MKTREEKQLEFLKSYAAEIHKTAYQNMDKVGYVELFVDEHFKLASDIEFIEGDFDDSIFVEDNIVKDSSSHKVVDSFYGYFVILWADNHTKWHFKKLLLIAERFEDYEKLN